MAKSIKIKMVKSPVITEYGSNLPEGAPMGASVTPYYIQPSNDIISEVAMYINNDPTFYTDEMNNLKTAGYPEEIYSKATPEILMEGALYHELTHVMQMVLYNYQIICCVTPLRYDFRTIGSREYFSSIEECEALLSQEVYLLYRIGHLKDCRELILESIKNMYGVEIELNDELMEKATDFSMFGYGKFEDIIKQWKEAVND